MDFVLWTSVMSFYAETIALCTMDLRVVCQRWHASHIDLLRGLPCGQSHPSHEVVELVAIDLHLRRRAASTFHVQDLTAPSERRDVFNSIVPSSRVPIQLPIPSRRSINCPQKSSTVSAPPPQHTDTTQQLPPPECTPSRSQTHTASPESCCRGAASTLRGAGCLGRGI